MSKKTVRIVVSANFVATGGFTGRCEDDGFETNGATVKKVKELFRFHINSLHKNDRVLWQGQR